MTGCADATRFKLVIPVIAPVIGLVSRFGRALRRGWAETEFRGLLYLVLVVIGLGTLFYRGVEGWGWIDSLYFTVITLTTIGYGDLSPSTPGSKLFTVVLVLVGIGLVVSFIERVARYAAEDQTARRHRRKGPDGD
jgi:voltage-gated potassium channel